VKITTTARRGGSRLSSQHFGRPRQADHLRSGVRDQPGQYGETPVSTNNTKISQVQWWAPVIPVTQEAKTGESLEPGRWRLQCAEIVPLHSSLGDKSETPSQNNNNNKKTPKTTRSSMCRMLWETEGSAKPCPFLPSWLQGGDGSQCLLRVAPVFLSKITFTHSLCNAF
uniref:Uncharacterized protein n=1 Tax=Macaca fascicularis TaxID=9541 RepID=A0A7N9D0L6_MACFA